MTTQITIKKVAGCFLLLVCLAGLSLSNQSHAKTCHLISYNTTDAIKSAKGKGSSSDTIPPVITLNGSDTVFVELFGTYIEDGSTAVDNRDGNLTNAVVLTGTVNTKLLGTYTLTFKVQDAAGNSTSKIRIVIVGDTQKPVINNADADSKNEVKVPVNSIFIDRTKVTDNSDNPLLVITKGPGTPNGVETNIIGIYTLIYDATDQSGNKADTKTYKYIVGDDIAPEINLNTADTVSSIVNTAYIPVQPTVKDNYYMVSQISLTKTSTVNSFKLGLYYDEYTATDGSGNVSVRRRFVRIVEEPAGMAVLDNDLGVKVYPNPSSGKISISCKSDSPELLAIEVYNVTGKLVAAIKGDFGKNGVQTIDLGGEPSGLYSLKIITNLGTTARKVSILK